MPTPIAEVDLGVVDALCRINTRAVLIVNREAARWLRTGGAIVNVSSSWRGITSRGYGVYGATTAATDVLTRSLALELRERNITVNAVAVGIDEVAVPHGIAAFIAYLLGADGHRSPATSSLATRSMDADRHRCTARHDGGRGRGRDGVVETDPRYMAGRVVVGDPVQPASRGVHHLRAALSNR